MSRAYPKVRARLLPAGSWASLCGREAETLMMLASKGNIGVRAYDFPGGPPFRLSGYVFDLRGFGFPIRTDREEHAGGFHAVYVLEGAVEIQVISLRPGGPALAA